MRFSTSQTLDGGGAVPGGGGNVAKRGVSAGIRYLSMGEFCYSSPLTDVFAGGTEVQAEGAPESCLSAGQPRSHAWVDRQSIR